MNKLGLIAALLLNGVILLFWGCSTSGQGQTSQDTTTAVLGQGQVIIKEFAFSPAQLTVRVGDTVTWTNGDSVSHTATGDGWNSGNLSNGQKYSKRFDTTGTYDYLCQIHPAMKGGIIVL
ncbi:MAG: cupredoxin family copper-binding protein [Chloroflexi bacterium]|nr:cupredoxin family copper-binding protein [Chloroflexota bacterium]